MRCPFVLISVVRLYSKIPPPSPPLEISFCDRCWFRFPGGGHVSLATRLGRRPQTKVGLCFLFSAAVFTASGY